MFLIFVQLFLKNIARLLHKVISYILKYHFFAFFRHFTHIKCIFHLIYTIFFINFLFYFLAKLKKSRKNSFKKENFFCFSRIFFKNITIFLHTFHYSVTILTPFAAYCFFNSSETCESLIIRLISSRSHTFT